ncbi:MAG: Unknown protein [uncultured Sulfurovum sp.]|uniref:Glycosyltransferase 2-like domain-containing protein n=1 Tax=uncultured Sulfurovum sp. TaxID=269237 RepID=A0A6S6T879_9BACT|nr:MAG: Unknown protein [uncultured Sulfurovum sp.]
MIPTYNQSQYIVKSIKSVLAQTYSNIEIIVSDDSTDNLTEEIVNQQFKKDIHYLHNSHPLGRVKNYHFLLNELAHGEWVINLDGDDYFKDKTFIEKAITFIKNHDNLVLVFGKQIVYKENLDKEYRYKNEHLKEGILEGNSLFLETIYKNIEIPHLASLYKRKKALELGFYESNVLSSDRESLLKILLNNQVAFLDIFVGVWNHHSSNASQNSSIEDFTLNLSLYDNLYSYALKHSQISKLNLWFWKVVAKYKNVYGYYLKLIQVKKYRVIRELLRTLMFKNLLLLLIFLVDIRVYQKVLIK